MLLHSYASLTVSPIWSRSRKHQAGHCPIRCPHCKGPGKNSCTFAMGYVTTTHRGFGSLRMVYLVFYIPCYQENSTEHTSETMTAMFELLTHNWGHWSTGGSWDTNFTCFQKLATDQNQGAIVGSPKLANPFLRPLTDIDMRFQVVPAYKSKDIALLAEWSMGRRKYLEIPCRRLQ